MMHMIAFVPSSTFAGRQLTSNCALHGQRVHVSTCALNDARSHERNTRVSDSNSRGKSASSIFRTIRSALLATCAVSAATLLPSLGAGQPPAAAAASSTVVAASATGSKSVRSRAPDGAPVVRLVPRGVAMAASPAIASKKVSIAQTKRYLPRFTLRDRFSYAVSEFLCWNPMARIFFLFATAVISILIGGRVFRAFDPSGSETDESPMWMSVRSYLNPLEATRLRILSVTMAMLGTVYFGIFIGMVTEAVESGIAAADGGASRVVASKHTVILGYNSNTSKIITDINAVSGTKTNIVVLVSEVEKENMMEELRDLLSEEQKKRIRISVRSGTPVLAQDLDKVAASRAEKIILSSGQGISAAESDRRILSRALALRSNLPMFSGDIIAELSSARDEAILQSILKDTNVRSVQAVSAERLLFRFMAQAMRNEGLADCVVQMMGENPNTVFHVLPVSKIAPGLVGMQFADIRPTAIPGAIVCGYVDPISGKVVIDTAGSKDAPALTSKSELLVLGVPSGRPRVAAAGLSKESSSDSRSKTFGKSGPRARRSSENILVCGWRPGTMLDLLAELDVILPRGSSVTIVDEDAPDHAKMATEGKWKNIAVKTVRERPDSYDTLEQILGSGQKAFDHILLLSSALGEDKESDSGYVGVEEDSKALTSLCYINDLLESRKGGSSDTTVTIEFSNERVADIAREQTSVTNVVLPNSLSAHIAAQTVRDSRLNSVWYELLSQTGKECYIRPAAEYLKGDVSVSSFANISFDAALGRQEIVVGYIPKGGEAVINPTGPLRFDARTWLPEDDVIVLADD